MRDRPMSRRDLPYLFARMQLDGVPGIVLARRLPGHTVRREPVWSCSFDDPLHRELVLAWLLKAAARWQVWGVMASVGAPGRFDRVIDRAMEENMNSASPVMIPVYRAAAYLSCTEDSLLSFRNRAGCERLFDDEPDPLLDGREIVFCDLGGLVRCMIEDAADRQESAS